MSNFYTIFAALVLALLAICHWRGWGVPSPLSAFHPHHQGVGHGFFSGGGVYHK